MQFNAHSTADEVASEIDLRGKSVLITGTSAGIGIETARALAARGANVLGAVRDIAKANSAGKSITEAAQASGGSYETISLDLGSLASVRATAKNLKESGGQFDIVINNAGIISPPNRLTVDGFDAQFGTNHLGHFALLTSIAPLLKDGGRLVCLTSSGHRFADVDLDDPNFETTDYDPQIAYARSKTANILFAVEFDRRHRERGVRACAVHPGGVPTELVRHVGQDEMQEVMGLINAGNEAGGEPPFEIKTLQQGAATSVWAAIRADSDEVGGRYCEDCHAADVNDGPAFVGVRSFAVDPANAAALWAKSDEWTKAA